MKLACIGDTHLGRTLFGYDLTHSIRRSMYHFLKVCLENDIDIAIHLGDVFDKPSPTEYHRKIMAQWVNEFARAHIGLVVLAGNHDVTGRPGSFSALDHLKVLAPKLVTVVYHPLEMGEYVFLPFPSPGVFQTFSDYLQEANKAIARADNCPILFTHLMVKGAAEKEQDFPYRGNEYTLPEELIARARFVVNGHIHNKRVVGRVLNIGSADRLRFDEVEGHKCFLIHDTKSPRIQWVKNHFAKRLAQVNIAAHGASVTKDNITSYYDQSTAGGLNRAIVKVQLLIDRFSLIDYEGIRDWFYEAGAEYVHIAPPIMMQEEFIRNFEKSILRDKLKAVRRYLTDAIADKDERVAVYRLFLDMRKRTGDENVGEEPCPTEFPELPKQDRA